MEIKASLRFIRVSPKKARQVADLIRGLPVEEAERKLSFLTNKSAVFIKKLLLSAKANAKNNFDIPEKDLFVAQVRVDEGPRMKRQMPRARGRVDILNKPTSHIKLILEELKNPDKKK